jgi:valacyclovir hydrolase
MGWYEHGETRIYYEEAGSGDALLLLPGWGGRFDELSVLKDRLAQSFRVIAADPPGSGRSLPQPRTYKPSYYFDDAQAFLAMLQALGVSSAHMVGFSDGGEYELLMAALKPEAVRSIAAWGAAGSLGQNLEMADAMATLIDSPIPPLAGFADHMKATYGEDNARTMTRSFGSSLRAIIEAGGDISRSRAAAISCPVLLITGENDFIAPPQLVSEMANLIPRGEFLLAEGATHSVHSQKPDWLIETIAGWLERQ